MEQLTWFIPSFYGDIRLQAAGKKECVVIAEQLTTQERKTLEELQKLALRKGWVEKGTLLVPTESAKSTQVKVPIEKVAKLIAKALKPGKQLVSAVKFGNGRMEEVHESTFTVSGATEEKRERKPKSETEPAPAPARATTVAAPTRGCPAPDFDPATLRAREVLMSFLDEGQREDFIKHNRFITFGATTGHRYMVTSRHARAQLERFGGRSLYDLDEQRAICTHDWDVPAEEEMHALNVLVQLPGHEQWIRDLPDDEAKAMTKSQSMFLCTVNDADSES